MRRVARISVLAWLGAGCLDTPGPSSDAGTKPDAATAITQWQIPLGASTPYVASTDDGPVIAAGFSGMVELGDTAFLAKGVSDLLLAVLDDDGKVRDAQSYGGEADEYPTAVAVSRLGGTIGVIGMYGDGEGELGGTPLPAPGNGYNLFVALYGPAAENLWAVYGSATDGLFPYYVLSMGGDGELAFAGDYRSMMELGSLTAVDVSGRDLFFARVTATGTPTALVGYADGGDQIGMGAVHDGLGSLFLFGSTSAAFMLDEFGIAGNDSDLFVAQVDESGTDATWAIASVGGAVDDLRAAATPDGDLLLTGRFEGNLAFGLPAELTSHGGSDVFIAKVRQDGVVAWLRQFGGSGDDEPAGLSVAPDGGIAVTGAFRGTASLRASEGDLTSAGGSDIFLLTFDADGALRRAQGFGGPEDDTGTSVAVGAGGGIVLGAVYRGEVDFGGEDPLSSGGDAAAAVIGFR